MTGESGEVASDEFELGNRLCSARKEKVGVMGTEALEVAEEFRECPGLDGGKRGRAVMLVSMVSWLREVEILGSFWKGMLAEMELGRGSGVVHCRGAEQDMATDRCSESRCTRFRKGTGGSSWATRVPRTRLFRGRMCWHDAR